MSMGYLMIFWAIQRVYITFAGFFSGRMIFTARTCISKCKARLEITNRELTNNLRCAVGTHKKLNIDRLKIVMLFIIYRFGHTVYNLQFGHMKPLVSFYAIMSEWYKNVKIMYIVFFFKGHIVPFHHRTGCCQGKYHSFRFVKGMKIGLEPVF